MAGTNTRAIVSGSLCNGIEKLRRSKPFHLFSPAFCSLQASLPCTGTRIWAEIWMEELCQAEMPVAMKAVHAEQNGIPHEEKARHLSWTRSGGKDQGHPPLTLMKRMCNRDMLCPSDCRL